MVFVFILEINDRHFVYFVRFSWQQKNIQFTWFIHRNLGLAGEAPSIIYAASTGYYNSDLYITQTHAFIYAVASRNPTCPSSIPVLVIATLH